MKILVIEDNRETADFLRDGLERNGHVVEIAENGRDGVFLATGESFDILIVDRMVPHIDGLAIVKLLRESGSRTPVLFLTAMSGVEDRVDGLDAGGDDYLVKPFAFSEVLARINALSRRPPLSQDETRIQAGELELDLIRHAARRQGKDLDLLPLEFRILECFMRNKGKVVTRTMLLERVWNFHFDPKTKVVEANISRLRAKLDRPFEYPLLKTMRRIGYILEPDGNTS